MIIHWAGRGRMRVESIGSDGPPSWVDRCVSGGDVKGVVEGKLTVRLASLGRRKFW